MNLKMMLSGRVPGPECIQQATGEEQGPAVSSQGINNVLGENLAGIPAADAIVGEMSKE